MLLGMFSEIVHTHTGRLSPMIERVRHQLDEYRRNLDHPER